jgi:hypothetical protein
MPLDLSGRAKPVYYWEQLPSELQAEWFTVLSDSVGDDEVIDDRINRENTPKTLGQWEAWVYQQR